MAKKYDDAAWHAGGDFPQDLPPEYGATHIGMFYCWAVVRGLSDNVLSRTDADRIRHRDLSPRTAVLTFADGKLTNEDLSAEANGFANEYYEKNTYYEDLADLFPGAETLYHIEDGWGSFEPIAEQLDRRLAEWRKHSQLGS